MALFGFLLIFITLTVAILIGRKANAGIRSFDESTHESFLGMENSRGTGGDPHA